MVSPVITISFERKPIDNDFRQSNNDAGLSRWHPVRNHFVFPAACLRVQTIPVQAYS
jgi:hypothetical protein